MTALPKALKLYLKLAVDRRQILGRYLAIRIALGGMAAIVLLVGVALLNVALYLLLRPMLGDIWSVLVVALLHFVFGGILTAYALSEPASSELTALAEAEASALEVLSTEAEDKLQGLIAAEQRIQRIGAGLSMTANVLPSLVALLNRTSKSAPGTQLPPADTAAGDKT